ncbi:tripartite tricarboxylate transporter substrate-binding protein, partial [Klebsiella pneumoniae]|uniref:tripartite tricarboxylate transporter substrate-binding protein n=1 Tax=Klebsiella pneumoniae TaxID=573 RepID=UPI0022287FAE
TTVHLSAALFEYMTGVKWTHIPYKGAGPALIEMFSGQFSLYFGNLPAVIGYARQGRLRGIAVSGAQRAASIPELPTIAEAGVPGYEVTT